MPFRQAVIDMGRDGATPIFLASSENPAEYDVPGDGGVNEGCVAKSC